MISSSKAVAVFKDYVSLTKPRITVFCVLMTWGGMLLAPVNMEAGIVLWTLLGTAMAVGSANTLNMFLERKSDCLMRRTKSRPLPSGRMKAWQALVFGLVMGVLSCVVLVRFVNNVTAILALFAIISYVLVYTPLKRKSPSALVVGAVPGAIPPLIGTAAMVGEVEKIGLVLFFILLLWQIPHFLAISLYSKEDYARAGIRTTPLVLGDQIAKIQATGYSFVLLLTSLLLVPLGVAGKLYLVIASVLGIWFVVTSMRGFGTQSTAAWARKFFHVTLIYLPALTLGLMLDLLI